MAFLEYLPPVFAAVVIALRLTAFRPRQRGADTKK
jgi:hypothetical protein